MDPKIKKFDPKYAEEMAQLFVSMYSDNKKSWDITTAKEYLERCYKNFPEINLMTLDKKDQITAAIFCQLTPYYKGKMLYIDSLQVIPKFRNQGHAKLLMKEIVSKAKELGYNGLYLMADVRADFPLNWYKKLGFIETGWAEFKVMIDDIRIN